MSEKLIQLSVVTPEGSIFDGDVKSILVSGYEGELGLSHGHLQLLTAIKPGFLKINHSTDNEELLFISGGILEVQPEQIIILADIVSRPKDLDEISAKKDLEEAEKMMKNKNKHSISEASKLLTESHARLQVLKMMRKVK